MSRYKFDRSREFIPGYKVGCGHWRSVAVQAGSETEICQGAGMWFEGTGAVSWYKAKSKPENCQGIEEFNCGQMRVSGCKNHYKFVLGAGAKQKP